MAVKVRQRNGKWWLFIDHKGRKKAKCVGSKEAAEKAKIMIEARLVMGADVIFEPVKKPEPPPPPLLFGDYFRTWLDTYVRHACKESHEFAGVPDQAGIERVRGDPQCVSRPDLNVGVSVKPTRCDVTVR